MHVITNLTFWSSLVKPNNLYSLHSGLGSIWVKPPFERWQIASHETI